MLTFKSCGEAVKAGVRAVGQLGKADVGAGAALIVIGAVVAYIKALGLTRDAKAAEMKRLGVDAKVSSRADRAYRARVRCSEFHKGGWFRLTEAEALEESICQLGAVSDEDGWDIPSSAWDVLCSIDGEIRKAKGDLPDGAEERPLQEVEALEWSFILAVRAAMFGIGARSLRADYLARKVEKSAKGEDEGKADGKGEVQEEAVPVPTVDVVLAALPTLSDEELARVLTFGADLMEARKAEAAPIPLPDPAEVVAADVA